MRFLRRLAIAGMLLAPILVIGYVAYWNWIAKQIRVAVNEQADYLRQAGYIAAWRTAEVDGFPFSFRLTLEQPNFEQNRALPAYALYADVVRAQAQPFDLHRWTIETGTDAGLDVTSAPGSARMSLRAPNVEGTFYDAASGSTLALHAAGLTAQTVASAGALPIARAEMAADWPAPSAAAAALVRASVVLHDVRLRQSGPLGDIISEISVAGIVSPPIPPGRWPDALARWRDAGGHIDLSTVRLRWGALNVNATGTLTLDRAVQPVGSGTAGISGLGPTLDALVERGALRSGDAAAAKLALGAFGGGSGTVTLPVRVDAGHLFVGPVRLLDLPLLASP